MDDLRKLNWHFLKSLKTVSHPLLSRLHTGFLSAHISSSNLNFYPKKWPVKINFVPSVEIKFFFLFDFIPANFIVILQFGFLYPVFFFFF